MVVQDNKYTSNVLRPGYKYNPDFRRKVTSHHNREQLIHYIDSKIMFQI